MPGEFYVAATRPPAVYRGNPFLIEVALAYGGVSAATRVPLEVLAEMLGESDARTLRQFLINTFQRHRPRRGRKDHHGGRAGQRGPRRASSRPAEIAKLHEAMRSVNLEEGQTMNVLRYANRVPLQFQHRRLRDHADR